MLTANILCSMVSGTDSEGKLKINWKTIEKSPHKDKTLKMNVILYIEIYFIFEWTPEGGRSAAAIYAHIQPAGQGSDLGTNDGKVSEIFHCLEILNINIRLYAIRAWAAVDFLRFVSKTNEILSIFPMMFRVRGHQEAETDGMGWMMSVLMKM